MNTSRLDFRASATLHEPAHRNRLSLSRRRDRRTGDYTPLEINGVQQLVRELGDRASITKPVHPHIFRHSAATWMLQHGMDSLLVARISATTRWQ